MKTITLSIFGALGLALVLTVLARLSAQHRVAIRIRIDAPNGVDTLEKVRLGGVEQWIRIRGRDRTKPILLFLHGGPGFAEMAFAHRNAALADDFVVVDWDQRGAGKSYASDVPVDSMTGKQIEADAIELVLLLLQRFGATKLYLVGHSWGTILGARIVAQHPELFHAYVALSQVANPPESERLMYSFALETAQKENNQEAISDLTKLGLPPYKAADEFQLMNRWINHYGKLEYREMDPMRFVRIAFASPAYSLADLVRLGFGYRFSIKHLWRDAFWIDFFKEIPRLEVPVYFFLGRHDRTSTASAELAALYFDALDAPRGKQLVWFENSGHWPHLNEPEKYRKVLLETVLAQTGATKKTSHE